MLRAKLFVRLAFDSFEPVHSVPQRKQSEQSEFLQVPKQKRVYRYWRCFPGRKDRASCVGFCVFVGRFRYRSFARTSVSIPGTEKAENMCIPSGRSRGFSMTATSNKKLA